MKMYFEDVIPFFEARFCFLKLYIWFIALVAF